MNPAASLAAPRMGSHWRVESCSAPSSRMKPGFFTSRSFSVRRSFSFMPLSVCRRKRTGWKPRASSFGMICSRSVVFPEPLPPTMLAHQFNSSSRFSSVSQLMPAGNRNGMLSRWHVANGFSRAVTVVRAWLAAWRAFTGVARASQGKGDGDCGQGSFPDARREGGKGRRHPRAAHAYRGKENERRSPIHAHPAKGNGPGFRALRDLGL